MVERPGGGGRGGGGGEDLLEASQAQEVEGRHLYVGLVAVRHVPASPGLHQLLHDLQSVLTAASDAQTLVCPADTQVYSGVVVVVTLHAEIHSHLGLGSSQL